MSVRVRIMCIGPVASGKSRAITAMRDGLKAAGFTASSYERYCDHGMETVEFEVVPVKESA